MADNPDFKLGDEYTGPAKTDSGKVINMKDGTFVEGTDAQGKGIRYVWTGVGDNFAPEGGWGATTDAQAAEDDRVDKLELDAYGQPQYTQVTRADGSDAPGVYGDNPEYYGGAATAPEDAGAVDKLGNPKYIVGEDRKGNPKWDLNPEYNSGDKPSKSKTEGELLATNMELAALKLANSESAITILTDLVSQYGLPASIVDFIKVQMVEGESSLGITQKIRATPEYASRFPAMSQRRELNLPAISEAEYLRLERDYRTVMQAANIPATFHDSPADFDQFIAGDVSAEELNQRVGLAEAAVDGANADIVQKLQDFYNLDTGDITAYYLDPERAKNIFEERRRFQAAGLGAASMQAVGVSIDAATAESLQRENVQAREVQQRLGQRRGLTDQLLGEEAALTASEIAQGEFAINRESQDKVRRRREERVSTTGGRSGVLTTGQGATGLGEAT